MQRAWQVELRYMKELNIYCYIKILDIALPLTLYEMSFSCVEPALPLFFNLLQFKLRLL